MAFTSLDDLKSEIQNWSYNRDDSDFVAQLGNFVTLAESRLNVDLAITTAEVDTTLTGTTDSRSLTLPSDFLEPVALWLTTYGTQEPLQMVIAGNVSNSTVSAPPTAWMINGSSIDLDSPCDQAHTFRFRYRMKLLDLATTSPNWLLTNHPDVYLFACLAEAADWSKENEEALKYEARYQSARARVGWLQSRAKSRAPLRVDAGLQRAHSFDINSGD